MTVDKEIYAPSLINFNGFPRYVCHYVSTAIVLEKLHEIRTLFYSSFKPKLNPRTWLVSEWIHLLYYNK